MTLSKDDPHLSFLMDYLSTPCPESQKLKLRARMPEHWRSLLSSFHMAHSLLFLDERLIMPYCLQKPIALLLHSTHAGARAMLSLAEFIWFPHMVRAIHSMARTCPSCTATGENLVVVSSKAATAPREPVDASGQQLELDFWGLLRLIHLHKCMYWWLLIAIRDSRLRCALPVLLRILCFVFLPSLFMCLDVLNASVHIRGQLSFLGT